MYALANSSMSYPTWGMICKEEGISPYVNPPLFGDAPLLYNNGPAYASITLKGVNTPCGIDIPILLEPQNNSKKRLIVILGESALRTRDELNAIKNPDNVILGVPYAIHHQQCPPKCEVYRKIFAALLGKGYSLYITDIIKVWWSGKRPIPNDLDIKILNKELKSFKNCNPIIVTFGKKSENALINRCQKKPNKDFLPLPHPGVNNWDRWKIEIYEEAIYSKGIKYATDRYKSRGSSTTSDIVATEVVARISDFIVRYP